jgi:hypothetical protein
MFDSYKESERTINDENENKHSEHILTLNFFGGRSEMSGSRRSEESSPREESAERSATEERPGLFLPRSIESGVKGFTLASGLRVPARFPPRRPRQRDASSGVWGHNLNEILIVKNTSQSLFYKFIIGLRCFHVSDVVFLNRL